MLCERSEVIPETFVYPNVNALSESTLVHPAAAPHSDTVATALECKCETATEGPLQEQLGWQQGFREGREQAVRDFQQALVQERETLLAALEKFTAEKGRYFQEIEAEVVCLVLAIARRVLYRETQTDPLALRGLVRVALEKLSAGGDPRLHLHPSRMAAWQDFLSEERGFPSVPELVSDPSLEPNDCMLVTAVGSTDIGLEAQMKEIEQGLFDLFDRRPRMSA